MRKSNRALKEDLQKLKGHNEHLERANADLTKRNDELLAKLQTASRFAGVLEADSAST